MRPLDDELNSEAHAAENYVVDMAHMAAKMRPELAQSLRVSMDDSAKRSPVAEHLKWLKGSGHWTYDPLARRIGAANINFITEGWRTSMADAQSVCDWQFYAGQVGMYTKEDEPIGVLRVCPVGNVSEPLLKACINWKETVNGSDAVGMPMLDGFGLQGEPLESELGGTRNDARRKNFFDSGQHQLEPHSPDGGKAR